MAAKVTQLGTLLLYKLSLPNWAQTQDLLHTKHELVQGVTSPALALKNKAIYVVLHTGSQYHMGPGAAPNKLIFLVFSNATT